MAKDRDPNEPKPKCPSCDVVGIEHIDSVESTMRSGNGDAWFEVACCAECGHVYGVFAKVVHEPKAPPLRFNV